MILSKLVNRVQTCSLQYCQNFLFFFFQAEDGIRDKLVTGVQTCALPIYQSHEATRTAQAIINLALMTGNLGRPGTGANSITGQCNAMGSRLFANASGLLGGRDFLNAGHRAEISHLLHIAPEKIPARNSLAYDQIMQGIADGRIKGLWVIATNTAHSWIDSARAGGALDKLEFLVVQDMFTTTDTAQKAHLVLPAAGW